ncbi:hypothetical protein Q9233_004513, partial [Columba guinea]
SAICYCDQFCASGSPGPVDCCPDYWEVCDNTNEPIRSSKPWPAAPSGCYKDGRYYGEGTIIKDNCNSCQSAHSDRSRNGFSFDLGIDLQPWVFCGNEIQAYKLDGGTAVSQHMQQSDMDTAQVETNIMKEIMDKGPVQGMVNLEDDNMHNLQCLLSKY